MLFAEAFLDEIRARIPLADVIGRRTRLVKRGREFTGLCPFHNEKSPSFTVNEEKGFYHCFGCGAHGDVITFVREAQNLSFVEAVEMLAGEAGLEVPKASPQERERAVKQKTLVEAVEAACNFFQAQLAGAGGAAARAYLERRGLDRAAIEHFRLGYAPAGSGLLKQQLSKDFPEAMLLEAGLIGQKEERSSFDYFRDRVMFPIFDRAGRAVAFGGRVLGDAKPKYLNSPETPIFQKGSMLYGLNWARQGVGKGAELIVTEGYMDVIALHRAGFDGAVAPLGTALTETQIEELWRLADEPILCFDGDAAGQRAATRALDRALPLLKPGKSLRFAVLTGGEDPDTLIAKFGADAMRKLLVAAEPLAEMLWRHEAGAKPADTPERKSDLSRRLTARAALIQDEGLRRAYGAFFRNCLYERMRPQRASRMGGQRGGRPRALGESRVTAPANPVDGTAPLAMKERRIQEILLFTIYANPHLLDEMLEEFAEIELRASDLDRLRLEILNLHHREPGLDAAALKHHLCTHGFSSEVAALESPALAEHVRFARRYGSDAVLAGWREAAGFWRDFMVAAKEREAIVARVEFDLPGVVGHANAILAEVAQRRIDEAEYDGSGRAGSRSLDQKMGS
ncbi:MAG TPA: DNA primase [Aliidongia sp.]|nr:DNA primase [Aliidongia sp.]